jgi:RHS repeat-associated protein
LPPAQSTDFTFFNDSQRRELLTKVNGSSTVVTSAMSAVTLSTSWQRFDLTTTLQNGMSYIALEVGGGGSVQNGQSFQIWGAQFVVGSVPGTYTPTPTTTTVYATGSTGTLVPTGLNQSYSYDSFGNILQNGSFNSTYTANNQMFGYGYDAAGNLLSDGFNVMTWDAESRLSTVSGATYIYDAQGNRVEKQGVGVTDTVYFGGRPIARYSSGGWTDLIYGPNGLLAEVPGTQTGAPVYRVTDNLGTNVGSLLSNGAFVNPVDHTPFGQILTGNTSDPYFLTGKERDTESGLDYFGARYYASNMGRWMSPDWADKPEAVPYSSLDNPQSLNLYGYVLNNPLSKADPDGHWPDCGWCSQVGSAVSSTLSNPRVQLAGKAALNIAVAGVKITEAAAGAAAAPETGGLTLAVTVYQGISAAGNLAAAASQIAGAVTGDVKSGQAGADVASAATTVSGVATLVATGGNVEKASQAADIENGVTTGLSGKTLFEGSKGQVATKVLDAAQSTHAAAKSGADVIVPEPKKNGQQQ